MIEFFDKEFAKTTAEAAATAIIAGIEKNAPRILIGGDARRLDWLQRILPGTYFRILKRGDSYRAYITRTRRIFDRIF